jgi:hypothetical protein
MPSNMHVSLALRRRRSEFTQFTFAPTSNLLKDYPVHQKFTLRFPAGHRQSSHKARICGLRNARSADFG